MKAQSRAFGLVAVVAAGVVLGMARGEAHKPVTSKYTYNEDVFPILRERCGRCHVSGGVAPMSLMTYADAYPWNESVRAELIAGHMPPWHAEDGAGTLKNAHAITAREIDTVLVWATGGYPAGDPSRTPPPVALTNQWTLGPPDQVLSLPEFTLAADKSEDTMDITLPTSAAEPRWVRAVDLLPGTPSIVRSATVSVKSDQVSAKTGSGLAPAHVLAVWQPGETPVPPSDGAAFRLPAGAHLAIRIQYRKTWKYERQAIGDRSAIGLYFAQAAATEIRALPLVSPAVTAASGSRVEFGRRVEEDVDALAFYPDAALANVVLEVDAVRPDGSRVKLVGLAVRPGWARRYWFQQPVALPRGSRLEAVALLNAADTLLPPAAAPAPLQAADGTPIRLTFEVVPRRARPASR